MSIWAGDLIEPQKQVDVSDFGASTLDVVGAGTSLAYESGLAWAASINTGLTGNYEGPAGLPWVSIPTSTHLDHDTALSTVKNAGFNFDVPVDGIKRSTLDLMIQRKRNQQKYMSIIGRGGTGSSLAALGGGFMGALADPAGIPFMFTPVPVLTAALTTKLAMTSGALARATLRAQMGIAEGALGATLMEPFLASNLKQLGDDYSMMDSLANVSFGALAGGLLGPAVGRFADFIETNFAGKRLGKEGFARYYEDWKGGADELISDIPNIRKEIDPRFYDDLAGVERILARPNLQPDEFFVAMARIDNLKRASQLETPAATILDSLPEKMTALNENGKLSPWIFEDEIRNLVWERLDDNSRNLYQDTMDGTVAKDAVLVEPKALPKNIESIDNVVKQMESKTDDLLGDIKRERESVDAFEADKTLFSRNASVLDKLENASPEIKSKAFEVATNQVMQNRPIDISSIFEFGEGKVSGQELNKRVADSFNDKDAELVSAEVDEYNKLSKDIEPEDYEALISERTKKLKELVDTLEDVDEQALDVFEGLEAKGKKDLVEVIERSGIPEGPKRKALQKFVELLDEKYLDELEVSLGVDLPDRGFGDFDPRTKILSVYNKALKNDYFDETFVHEIWHSLARYLPESTIKTIENEFKKDRLKYEKMNRFMEFFRDTRELTGSAYRKFKKEVPEWEMYADLEKIKGGVRLRKTVDNYRFLSVDEWFAETMKDYTFDPSMMPKEAKNVWQTIRNLVQRMYESIRDALGPEDTKVIFRNYMRGKYEGIAREGIEVQDPNIYKLDLETKDPTQVYYDTITPQGVRNEMEQMKKVVAAIKQENKLYKNMVNTWPDKETSIQNILNDAPNYSYEQADALTKDLENEIAYLTREVQKSEVIQHDDILSKAIENLIEANDLKASQAELKQLISLEKRVLSYKKILRSEKAYDGVYGILYGNYDNAESGRISIETIQNRNAARVLGGFVSDMKKAHLFDMFQKRDNEEYLAEALLALGEGNADGLANVPADIRQAAEIVYKYQEDVRRMMNEHGALVGKRSDYISSQSHDMLKIQAVEPDVYIDFLKSKLDLEKTFGAGADEDQIKMALLFVYQNFATGNFIKNSAEASSGNVLPPGIGRRVSKSRSLHFKDARSWLEYQNEYGVGDLHTSIINGLIKGSKSAGIMEMLGPEHINAFNSVIDGVSLKLKRQGKFDDVRALNERSGRFQWIMEDLDGTANIPVDGTFAKAMSVLRTLETQRLMGGVVMSQMGDLAVAASELKYHGVSPFARYSIPVLNIAYSFPGNKARKELAQSMGILPDVIMGDLLSRFDNPEMPGKLNELTNIFMRMTGMNAWTDGQRAGLGLALSNIYASMSDRQFRSLPKGSQILMKKYGITSSVWDTIRSAELKEVDGVKYLTPEAIEQVDFGAAQKYRTFLIDRLYQGVLQPDAYTRSITTGGSQRGTPSGELFRTVFQFKRFMTSMFTQVWGRDLKIGQQADMGRFGGIGELFVMSSMMGFMSYSLKEIAKGREPINPVEFPGKAFLAGALQGGGLGIFGDFLFRDLNRFGVSLGGTILGPVPGRAEQFFKFLQKAATGEASKEDAALFTVNHLNALNPLLVTRGNAAFNAAVGINAINLAYIRPVLNYLALNALQESANPGYFRRQERNLKKEGREFIISPL